MWRLSVLAVASLAAVAAADPDCDACDTAQCAVATDCYAGVVMDPCNCCAVCGRREGETCDDPSLKVRSKGLGRCGENLECRILKGDKKKGKKREAICVCKDQEMVCGSDDKTYDNLCQLMEAAYRNGTKHAPRVEMWGPCETAPVIVNGPKEQQAEFGGKLVIDCEVKGFPIPEIYWEKTGEDGRTIALPGDYVDMAIQTRGGPQKLMVTGWVQIVDLMPQDSGTYTCIAKNPRGETRASASIGIYKGFGDAEL